MKNIEELKKAIDEIKPLDYPSVGLIHTKGALHEGHRRLIEAARKENKLVIVSNVTIQREFSSLEAYELYPKESIQDKALVSLAGADFFFRPETDEAFEGSSPIVSIQLNEPLKEVFNGMDRPRYYEEYLTTLIKLLNIIRPNRVYISDKDLQKVYFTKLLFEQFQYPCQLKVLPAARDEEGMLISTQMQLLKDDERKQVLEIVKIFNKAQTAYQKGMDSSRKMKWHVENEMSKLYLCQLEFVEVVEPERLRKIETITGEAILILGVRVGKVRLYDYIRLTKNNIGKI